MLLNANRSKRLLKQAKKIYRDYLNYERFSFKFKLIFVYIFLSLLPISLIVVVSYHFYSTNMEKRINDLIEYNLIQTSENIKTTLDMYKDLVYSIVNDEEVNRLFHKFNTGTNIEKAITRVDIREKFIIYSYPKWSVRSVVFINNNMEYAGYEKSEPTKLETVWNNIERNRDIFIKASSSDGIALLPTSKTGYQHSKKEQLFYIVLKIKNFSTQKMEGVLVLGLQESVLSDILSPRSTPEWQNILHTNSLVTDQQGQIISCPDKDYIGRNINDYIEHYKGSGNGQTQKSGSIPLKYDSRSTIVNEKAIDKTPWIIVSLADKDSLFKEVNFFRKLVVFTSIGIAMVFTLIIMAITRHYTISVRHILDGMKLAQSGQLSVQLELESKDEFFVIAERFNIMMRKIKQLVEEVNRQKEDIQKAINMQKDAEMRALEAQINPHFLYNTLDCINWLAIEKEEHDISQMLSKLARILRYSINKSNSIVMMEEEIDWMNKYIYIQQQRFNNSFECILNMDEEAKKFPVHKLLFQPFIENAIIHGFEGYKTGGILKISVRLQGEGFAEIRIEDNGNGMREEILSRIQSSIDSSGLEEESIGVYNIINRIKMYYGDQARLEMWSKEGQGTKILLRIPMLEVVGR